MYSWPPRALTALALILSAQSAAALTPEEAWAGWQALGSTSGQTITATGTPAELAHHTETAIGRHLAQATNPTDTGDTA